MSELEKARAGVFLSLLALTLTWLLLSNSDDLQSSAEPVNPIALCATTHGAVCDVTGEVGSDVVHLGEIVVTASRLPTNLGHMVVSATRLPGEPFAKVQLANAKRDLKDSKSIVVQ